MNEVSDKSKLQFYSSIKSEMGVEKYLSAHINKHERSLITQLRCGIIPIQLELGRYSNVSRDQRICKLCNDGVETETHFIFECKKLEQKRIELFHLCPNLLNYSQTKAKYLYLNNRPYVLGKYISKM